jgi:tRNA(fMet)-specific endonuclease VapC
MLDTNTLIYFVKNKPASVADRINALNDTDTLCMSFVTYAELLKGAEGSVRKPEVLLHLAALTRQVQVAYPAGPAICSHFAVQAMRLKQKGLPIGANDLWIACHALADSAILVTHNVREFGRVEGLPIEDWVA